VLMTKNTRLSTERFSKTLSLPVQTWAKLEEIRTMTRLPDMNLALQDCIESKHESLLLVMKMAESQEREEKHAKEEREIKKAFQLEEKK